MEELRLEIIARDEAINALKLENEEKTCVIAKLSEQVNILSAKVSSLINANPPADSARKRKPPANQHFPLIRATSSTSIATSQTSDLSVSPSLNTTGGEIQFSSNNHESENVEMTEEGAVGGDVADHAVGAVGGTEDDAGGAQTQSSNGWNYVSLKTNKNKTPPIYVEFSSGGFAAMYSKLKRVCGNNSFTVEAKRNGTGAKLFPANVDAHKSIGNALQSSGYVYHTHLMADQRKKSYLIRGFDSTMGFTTDEIADELVRAGLPADITISPFATGHMRQNNPGMSLYRLVVPAGFNESLFNNIRAILGVGVRFTLYTSKSTTQCSNCQSYFHTAAGCHRKYRCVKCDLVHLPGQCPKANDVPPKCVNCGGSHPANNQRDCSYYNEKILPLLNKRNPNGTSKHVVNNNHSNGNSYASVLVPTTGSGRGSSTVRNSNANFSGANTQMDTMLSLMMRMIENQDEILARIFDGR